MDIIKSIQDSAEGWKMFLGGGMQNMQNSAQVGGPFAAVKAAPVVRQVSGEAAPVGVRYMTSGRSGSPLIPLRRDPRLVVEVSDPGTPATVVERIQKSISNSVEGWRMGFASVAGKAKEAAGIVRREAEETAIGLSYGVYLTGEEVKKGVGGVSAKVSSTAGGVGEWFGNLGEGMSSMKWVLYIIAFVLIFVAIMTSIGYSGLGAPAARVAEREYVKRR